MLRHAGWRGLYSGFLPRLLAAVPRCYVWLGLALAHPNPHPRPHPHPDQVPRSVCTVLAYERAIAFCKRDKT